MHLGKFLWQGVYQSFQEAGGDVDAFDSDIWINKQQDKIKQELCSIANSQVIANSRIAKDYPLPLVTAMLLSQQSQVSILDFGGHGSAIFGVNLKSA